MQEKLSNLNPPIEDKGRILLEIASGFEKGQLFFTALELGIFNILKEPKTAFTLSLNLGTKYEITKKFLDVLVAIGVLARDDDDRFFTSPDMVPFIVEDEPYYAHYLKFYLENRNNWMNFKQILKEGPSGKHAHEHKYDKNFIDWIARGAMLGRLQHTIRIVSTLPEFKNAKRMIDLGGGHGLFGIGFAQENPQLEVFIFDKPGIVNIAQENINKYGVQSRVKTIAGDYKKDDIGSNYDIIFEACSFEGVKDEAISFYRKISDALNNKGLFISQTFTIDNDRKKPLSTLIWDLKNEITGHAHMSLCTNAELFDIFKKAGLSGEQVIDMSELLSMPMRIIIARKN